MKRHTSIRPWPSRDERWLTMNRHYSDVFMPLWKSVWNTSTEKAQKRKNVQDLIDDVTIEFEMTWEKQNHRPQWEKENSWLHNCNILLSMTYYQQLNDNIYFSLIQITEEIFLNHLFSYVRVENDLPFFLLFFLFNLFHRSIHHHYSKEERIFVYCYPNRDDPYSSRQRLTDRLVRRDSSKWWSTDDDENHETIDDFAKRKQKKERNIRSSNKTITRSHRWYLHFVFFRW